MNYIFRSIHKALQELNTQLKSYFLKPFPNEHSCRLQDPGKFSSFNRINCFRKSAGKCIDYIFGIKGGKSEVSSLRYKKSIWTESSAKNHCKNRGGKFEAAKK